MTLTYKGVEYKAGSRIKAMINGQKVDGKLQFEDLGDNHFYFICHNDESLSGRYTENRFGYIYSWAFKKIGKIKKWDYDGTLSDSVIILGVDGVEHLKDKFEISNDLQKFFGVKRVDIHVLENKQIFPEYNKFEVSENKGMIKLVNLEKNRTTDLKFGRFLNTLSKQCVDKLNLKPLFDNKVIEKLHNDYLSYQTGDYIKVEYLVGENILDGYKKDNYHSNKSSLGGSCMTDKLNYLKLYTNNPDKIQMICVKIFEKIVGRALLWTTDCGKKVMDKIYICDEWVGSKFDEIKLEHNYENWSDYGSSDNILSLTLNTDNIEKWPYLDTFQFLVLEEDKTKATLSTYPPKGYSMRLRSTGGGYEDCDWR